MLKKKILFWDIETHYVIDYQYIPEIQKLAFQSHGYDQSSDEPIEVQYRRMAGLIPEFGHPICVSFGFEDSIGEFHLSSIAGANEEVLLQRTSEVLNKFYESGYVIGGFNSDGFDNPFMAKHFIMNGMKVPKMINSYGKKPWEVDSIDVMKLWKLGSYGNTSLQVIAAALGLASKTESVTGSNLWEIPIEKMDWNELKKYCEEDVFICYKEYEQLVQCVY